MNIPKGFRYKDGSPVDLKFAKKQIDKSLYEKAYKIYVKNTHNLYKDFLDVAIHVLHDEFGFGDMRNTKFKDAMTKELEYIADEYVDWSDYRGNIKMIEK